MSSPPTHRASQSATKTDTTLRRVFTNQTEYPFVDRSRTWALVSLAVLALCLLGVLVRGVDFSIEFTGGTAFTAEGVAEDVSEDELRREVSEIVDGDVHARTVVDQETGERGAVVQTPTLGAVGGDEERAVQARIAELTGVEPGDVSRDSVGPQWGEVVTEQALLALVVFFALVTAYIALRFEWRMALAALITLAHDVLITIGVYAIVGFEVSPASVIALLTILGYSLYDTVVVFDRVIEDTSDLNSTSTRTYPELANRALNRVVVRSISTSVTSLLPVGSLLFIGGNLLGADTLIDLALALFVGMGVGTYSSIFVATPLLVHLKLRDPEIAKQTAEIITRRGGAAAAALQGGPDQDRPSSAGKGGDGSKRRDKDRKGASRDGSTQGKKKRGPRSKGP